MFCVELELPCVCADMFWLTGGEGKEKERRGILARFADVE
jgi:hypothetical protein